MATTSSDPLFTPWSIGPIELKHRIILAPLTRIRADIDDLSPNDLIGEYYEQRASDGGLIITEVNLLHPRQSLASRWSDVSTFQIHDS